MVEVEVITVVKGTPTEWIDQMAKLERKTFPKHESAATTLAKEALKPHNTMLLAIDENKRVVGYLLYRRSAVVGWIDKLAVGEQYRRQGIGRTMMRYAIEGIKQSRAISAVLMVELERKGAQALYKSLGFEIQSKRDDYYKLGRHAYYMELNLIQQ